MQKLFVPYELAYDLMLKQFREECFTWYDMERKTCHTIDQQHGELLEQANTVTNLILREGLIAAPMYQQVVDWFRTRHLLVLDVFQEFDEVNKCYTGLWQIDISKLNKYEDPHEIIVEKKYMHYYDAWKVAIETALKYIK